MSHRAVAVHGLVYLGGAGAEHEKLVGEQHVGVVREVRAEFAHEGFELGFVGHGVRFHLGRKVVRDEAGADVDLAAVHAGGDEIAHALSVLAAYAEHDDYAARLVLAEVGARGAADDDFGHVRAVFLHVYADAVACVAAYENLAVAHAVARRVAAVAVYDDGARVHRVAERVLAVAVDLYGAVVEICAESVAGHAVDDDVLAARARGDVALAEYVIYLDVAVGTGLDQSVQLRVIHSFGVYNHDILSFICRAPL